MKVMIVEPGAAWSTADVSAGLLFGMQQQGVEIVRYRLTDRIGISSRMLYTAWRQAKKKQPDIVKPTQMDVFIQAGKDALFMALWHKVDVVLVVSAMFFQPVIMEAMQRAGLKVAVLFTESPYEASEPTVAKIVECCWTNERTSLRTFRASNRHSGYLPHAWHPERHKPTPQPGDERFHSHDVVFVGSGFHERIEWLNAIDWSGIDLGLYGNWESLGKRHQLRQFVRGQIVDNVSAAALYRRAKINLNIYRTSRGWGPQAAQIARAESLNPRAYEFAACGAFNLSTYRAEVPDVFGELVPMFESPAEASALIRRWLADPEGRAEIARQLPACVSDMSWVHRAAQVVSDLKVLLQPTVAVLQHPRSQAVGAA